MCITIWIFITLKTKSGIKKKKVKGVVCFWLSFIVIESRDREESGHGRQKKGINRFIKMLPIPPPPSELPNTNANSLLHYYID